MKAGLQGDCFRHQLVKQNAILEPEKKKLVCWVFLISERRGACSPKALYTKVECGPKWLPRSFFPLQAVHPTCLWNIFPHVTIGQTGHNKVRAHQGHVAQKIAMLRWSSLPDLGPLSYQGILASYLISFYTLQAEQLFSLRKPLRLKHILAYYGGKHL